MMMSPMPDARGVSDAAHAAYLMHLKRRERETQMSELEEAADAAAKHVVDHLGDDHLGAFHLSAAFKAGVEWVRARIAAYEAGPGSRMPSTADLFGYDYDGEYQKELCGC